MQQLVRSFVREQDVRVPNALSWCPSKRIGTEKPLRWLPTVINTALKALSERVYAIWNTLPLEWGLQKPMKRFAVYWQTYRNWRDRIVQG